MPGRTVRFSREMFASFTGRLKIRRRSKGPKNYGSPPSAVFAIRFKSESERSWPEPGTPGRRSPTKIEVMAQKLFVVALLAASALAAVPAQTVFPYPYTQQDLPNGLRLIVVPTDFPNIVATYIVV